VPVNQPYKILPPAGLVCR